MLKPFYQNESDIPENQKGAYVAKNGRFELDKLEETHPVLAKNRELLEKNTSLTETNQRLISDLATAESKGVPQGKITVDKAEYETLKSEFDTLKTDAEAYKALGTLDEIKPKVEGYDGLKAQTKQALRDKALMAAGVTDLDRARRFKSYDDLEIESELKDGKETYHRVVKDDKGKESKVVFDSELLKSDGFKDDLGSLLTNGMKHFRQSTRTSEAAPSELASEHMKNRYKGIPAKTTT